MKRRTFVLRTVAAAGALGIGWALLPPRSRMGDGHDVAEQPGEHALNGWVKIGADDHVTVLMPKSEMGQGIHTALAMILADELDADWSMVRVEAAPLDAIYNNIATVVDGLPFRPDDHGLVQRTAAWLTAKTMRHIGVMITGGSSSVKDLWLPMRQAGAAVRAMLVAEAAAQWNVAPDSLTVQAGVVQHADGRRARFGALVAGAAQRDVPARPVLKTPDRFRIIGTPRDRLEGTAKQQGTATFGIDVVRPGMVYATVAMCPTLGGRVASFDAASALAMPGVRRVVSVDGYSGGTAGVAVIADTPYHALRAVRAVRVRWDHGAMAGVSSAQLVQQLRTALDTHDGHAYWSHGDVDAALAASARRVSAEYVAPYLAHATMEPLSCTVHLQGSRATVWAATQVPGVARHVAAKALGLDDDQVDVHVQFIGGGFGRRLDVDFIAQAAAIAKAAPGVPVQTFWSREEDVTHDFYRPACVARFTAGLDDTGALRAWRNTSAGQALVSTMLDRYFGLPGLPIDKSTSEGAFDQPYEFPATRVAHQIVPLPVPVGFWRAVGHSHQAFFTESFMDEVALAAGADPVAFRLALLRAHPRHARVLQRVAELAQWRTPLPAPAAGVRTGRGVALHESFGAVVAHVAEVAVQSDDTFRVTRITGVIDCGTPVNPNHIRQQMEGGIIFGLSAALHGEITIENGRVRQSNFTDYRVLRMPDTPEIVVDIVPSVEHPEGVGEPPLPPVAPAVANALFAATGVRLRSLPLRLPPTQVRT